MSNQLYAQLPLHCSANSFFFNSVRRSLVFLVHSLVSFADSLIETQAHLVHCAGQPHHSSTRCARWFAASVGWPAQDYQQMMDDMAHLQFPAPLTKRHYSFRRIWTEPAGTFTHIGGQIAWGSFLCFCNPIVDSLRLMVRFVDSLSFHWLRQFSFAHLQSAHHLRSASFWVAWRRWANYFVLKLHPSLDQFSSVPVVTDRPTVVFTAHHDSTITGQCCLYFLLSEGFIGPSGQA